LISGEYLSNIAARVFVQLFVIAKYNNCNVNRAKYGKLVGLLEQAAFALEESSADTN
jgi:hypothetical protein